MAKHSSSSNSYLVFLDSPVLGKLSWERENSQRQVWITEVLGGLARAGCHLECWGRQVRAGMVGLGLESLKSGGWTPEGGGQGKTLKSKWAKAWLMSFGQSGAKTIGTHRLSKLVVWVILKLDTVYSRPPALQTCLHALPLPSTVVGVQKHVLNKRNVGSLSRKKSWLCLSCKN